MRGSFLRVWDVSAPGGCCVKAHRQQSAGGVLGVRHPASLVHTEGDTPSRGPRLVVRTKKHVLKLEKSKIKSHAQYVRIHTSTISTVFIQYDSYM